MPPLPPLPRPAAFRRHRHLRRQVLAVGALASGLVLAVGPPGRAASALLESVKQNPAQARQLCDQFKQLNAQGQSATSPESIAQLAASRGLSKVDAEVLATYVIGLHCPDVR